MWHEHRFVHQIGHSAERTWLCADNFPPNHNNIYMKSFGVLVNEKRMEARGKSKCVRARDHGNIALNWPANVNRVNCE